MGNSNSTEMDRNGLLIASSSSNSKFNGKKVYKEFDLPRTKATGLPAIKSDISKIKQYHSTNK